MTDMTPETESPFRCRNCGKPYERNKPKPYGTPGWRHPEPRCEKPQSDGLPWKELFREKVVK